MDSARLQPALFGGMFIGVLSALPLVQAGNCCCCLWVIAGGVLAAYLRQQNTPFAITSAEGALVGLMAGALGGVLQSLLSIPMQAITGPMQQRMMDWVVTNNPEFGDFRGMLEGGPRGGAFLMVSMLFTVVVYTVFGLLGGLLGTAVFRKNAPPPPPGTVEVLPPE